MLILINIIWRNKVNSDEYRNIRKSRNKIVKISTNSKIRNFLKFKS